jgi:Mg2+ and Co2+ transporter CorA
MKIYDLIKVLGIITLFFLTITFILGFFKINIKNRFLLHKISGLITFVSGLIHGFLVFYITYIK